MIGKLTGAVSPAGEGAVLVDAQGVGYLVRVPVHVLASHADKNAVGKVASLFIHTAVRDDAIELYGFPTAPELSFFKLLMSVSGVGPKTALGILNVADIQSLKRSIALGDSSALNKVYGIGKKSAERIVVELRDKLAKDTANTAVAVAGSDGEVVEALMALGYSAPEAREAIKEISKDAKGTQARLSAALRYLSGVKA
jgi:Holliday junction DNA helicase RuvA